MKRILTLLILFFTALVANASDNVLQSVQIDSIGDTYNIVLKSDIEPNLKKTIQASDKIVLTLKDIRASKTLNTIYNNTTSVDSVMVEPVGKDNLNITIQADNVSNASVTFDTLNSALNIVPTRATKTKIKKEVQEEKAIVLSQPIESYTPIYNEENLEEESYTEEGFLGGILGRIKGIMSQEGISSILTTGLIGVILFCGVKLIRREDSDVKIGLSQSLKEREIDLYKDMSMRRGVNGPMSMAEREMSQFQQPQSQQFPQQAQQMPIASQINPNMGYGIKAYQSGVKNPYMTSDILQSKPVAPSVMPQQRSSQRATVAPQARQTAPLGGNRPVQNMAISQPDLKPSNIDSMKFLESMTKIYEKSGRNDLAQGLKASIIKAKAQV